MAPKVFVSYAHESPRHQDDVLAFASFLRSQGVDAVLDVWSADARHDWNAWAMREMTAAAYVIVVASQAYRAVGDGSGPADQHRGVQSEATLLRDLVYSDRDTWTPKVLPVLLPGHGIDEIPLFLSPYTTSRFPVTANTLTGAEDLLRVIHRSPGHVAPPVLAPPVLAPRPAPLSVVWCAGLPMHLDPDAVEVHLVPGEEMAPLALTDMRGVVGQEARSDEAGTMAWGTGLAVLATGQRSAWFTPSGQLVDAVAERVELLAGLAVARPASWTPAIGAGSALIVLPRLASEDLRAAEVATALVTELQARRRPQSGNRFTNTLDRSTADVVIQAGIIEGGVHHHY